MMMTTTAPLSPVNHLHHCSNQASSHPYSPSVRRLSAVSQMFSGDLELDALFAVIADMLTLERAVYQRCIPRQLPLSDRQSTNLQKCARFLTDLVAAALPPHTGGFALDLAHTWSARGDNDIDLYDILPLAAAVFVFIEIDPEWSHLPRYPRALPDLLTNIAQLPNVAHSVDNHMLEVLGYELATLLLGLKSSHVVSLGRTTALTAVAREPPRGATSSAG